jgi:hypothetical protein
MANRILTNMEVLYEFTKEDIEDILIPGVEARLGESLPFTPNRVTVQASDHENGLYQVRFEFDERLPQVLPLRGPAQ